jgi:lysophospholipase L1-like esterase
MTDYVVVGDSQAEGLLMSNALPAVLGTKLVGSFDRRGWSSRRLLDDGAIAEAAARAASAGATLMIVAGGNDPIPDTSGVLASYKATLLEILRAASAAGVRRLLWFGPVFARTEYDAVQHPQVATAQRAILGSSEARAAAGRMAVKWIDSQPLTRDLAREENVHLTADGYRVYAERVAKAAGGGGGLVTLAALALVGYAGYRAVRG